MVTMFHLENMTLIYPYCANSLIVKGFHQTYHYPRPKTINCVGLTIN